MSQAIFSNTYWNLSRKLTEGEEINEYVLELNDSGFSTAYDPDTERVLYSNILKIWENTFHFMNMEAERSKMKITVESMERLTDFLSAADRKGYMNYNDATQMVYTLGNTCIQLQQQGISMPFLDPKDILVINKTTYIYLGTNYVSKNRDGSISIMKPYPRNYYFSPELMSVRAIPTDIMDSSWIYSFAAIIIRYIYQQKLDLRQYDYRNPSAFQNYVGEIIQSIQSTKLYYFLMRCIEPQESRLFLFI